MPILEPGAKAPSFHLRASDGSVVDSEALKAKAVVVFYPGNNTPG